jgi:anti-sigma regulatory factor (Ser/Thr protein kinase)
VRLVDVGERHADLRFTLAVEPAAPAAAREALRAFDQLADGMRPDLELLVSELVANVVQHSGLGVEDSVDVDIRIEPGFIRAEVRDLGRGLPFMTLGQPRPRHVGYGVFLVSQIARRWGTRAGPGTAIWFELEEQEGSAEGH